MDVTKNTRYTNEYELDLDNINPNTDIDFTLDEDFDPDNKDDKDTSIDKSADNVDFSDDLEIELIEQEDETEDTTKKKTEVEKEFDEESQNSEEAVDNQETVDKTKKKRTSKAQQRIVQLANEKKKLLEERLADEQEKKKLKEQIAQLQKSVSDESLTSAESLVKDAKIKYAQAYEEGDGIKIAEATTALQQATFKLEVAKMRKGQAEVSQVNEQEYTSKIDALTNEMSRVDYDVQVDETPQLEPKAVQWLERNKFIFTSPEVNKVAGIIFDQLREDGYNPEEFDTYQEMEERLLSVYPQLEKMFKRKIKNQSTEETTETKQKPKVAPPVAGSTGKLTNMGLKATQNPNKVKYTPTVEDRDMASSLGLDLKLYVKEKIKAQQAAARGSSQIQII